MAKSLQQQTKRLERRLKHYSAKEVPRATASALNKTTKKVKTQLARSVVQDVKVPARFLKKQIFTSRAKSSSLSACVRSYLRPISAARLLTSGRLKKAAPRGTNRRGVRVAGEQFDGAFVNRGKKNGRYLVMRRAAATRYPVQVVSIRIDPSITANQLPITRRVHRADFARIYEHELKYRARKYGR